MYCKAVCAMGVLDESADYLQDLKAVRVDTLETRRLRIVGGQLLILFK